MHEDIREFLNSGGWFTAAIRGGKLVVTAKRSHTIGIWAGLGQGPDLEAAIRCAINDFNMRALTYIKARGVKKAGDEKQDFSS